MTPQPTTTKEANMAKPTDPTPFFDSTEQEYSFTDSWDRLTNHLPLEDAERFARAAIRSIQKDIELRRVSVRLDAGEKVEGHYRTTAAIFKSTN